MPSTLDMTLEALADDLAKGKIPSAELVDVARAMEAEGKTAYAWACAEAVAIRIVDHPNDPRKEESHAAVNPDSSPRIHPAVHPQERLPAVHEADR